MAQAGGWQWGLWKHFRNSSPEETSEYPLVNQLE